MFCQRGRIADSGGQQGSISIGGGLDDAYHFELFPGRYQVFHIMIIFRFISPDAVLTVILVVISAVYQFKGNAKQILISVISKIIRGGHRFFINELLYHLVQLQGIPQSQRVEQKIAQSSAGSQDYHTFMIRLGPASRFHIVLITIQGFVFGHLIENVGAHHGGHHAVGTAGRAKAQGLKGTVRMNLADGIAVFLINLRGDAVCVFDGVDIRLHAAFPAVQIGFQGCQVVGIHLREHFCDHSNDMDVS